MIYVLRGTKLNKRYTAIINLQDKMVIATLCNILIKSAKVIRQCNSGLFLLFSLFFTFSITFLTLFLFYFILRLVTYPLSLTLFIYIHFVLPLIFSKSHLLNYFLS